MSGGLEIKPNYYWVRYSRRCLGSDERIVWSSIIPASDYEIIFNDKTFESPYDYILLDSAPATQEDWDNQCLEGQ